MTRIKRAAVQSEPFGEAIKEHREALGLSIRDASALADVNWHSWDGVEKGLNRSIVIWDACASALGLELFFELEPKGDGE